jgi:hypothetical protein
MVNEQPLGPGDEEYRTPVVTRDVAPTGDPLEPGSATAGESSPPWIVVAVVLLVVFVAILVYAVVLPLVR